MNKSAVKADNVISDITLLESAAKAAGFLNWTKYNTCLFIETGHSRGSTGYHWNPLTDDGDALRLAITVGINIQHGVKIGRKINSEEPTIETFDSESRFDGWIEEVKAGDALAATRLAIVRAAAEIGKAL